MKLRNFGSIFAIAAMALALVVTAPAAASQNSGSEHLSLTGYFSPGSVTSSDELAPSIDQIPPHSPLNKGLRHTSAARTPAIPANTNPHPTSPPTPPTPPSHSPHHPPN